MKRFISYIGLFLLLGFLSGCGDGGLVFEEFSPPNNLYKLKMPGKPTLVPGQSPATQAFEVLTGTWEFGIGTIKVPVSANSLTGPALQKALDARIRATAAAENATVKSQTSITKSGFNGVEFELFTPASQQKPQMAGIFRIYLVHDMFLMQAVEGPVVSKDAVEVKLFLDSLVINTTPVVPEGGTSGAPGTYGSASMHGAGTMPANTASGNPGSMHGGSSSNPGLASTSGTYGSASPMPMPMGMHGANGTSGSSGTYGAATSGSSGTYGAATTSGSNGTYGATSGPMANVASSGHAGSPGQNGSLNNQPKTPVYTGTPVTATTKLSTGDTLQAFLYGQWMDVKVQKAHFTGLVQVKVLAKDHAFTTLPRSMLQITAGSKIAADDSSGSDVSGIPDLSSTGLPKSTRPSSTSKPTASKPTTAKGGFISLDGASIDDLLKIIATKSDHRRVLAAEQLREHSSAGSDPEVTKKLAELLKVEEITVRAAVAKALEKWYSPEIKDIVLKNFKSTTIEVHQSMMKILAANKVEGSAPLIAGRLSDKDDRKLAMELLISFGEPAQPAVIALLKHEDSKIKMMACDILKEIGTDDARTAMKNAVDTWSGTDRITARKTLQYLEAKK